MKDGGVGLRGFDTPMHTMLLFTNYLLESHLGYGNLRSRPQGNAPLTVTDMMREPQEKTCIKN